MRERIPKGKQPMRKRIPKGKRLMRKRGWNRKKQTLCFLGLLLLFLAALLMAGSVLGEKALMSDFSSVNQPPSAEHIFGTDWLGRDMLARTLRGLSLSILLGAGTAAASAVIALVCGILAAMNQWADSLILYLIDLVLGIPHLLLLILISLALGRGLPGVAFGILLTHWPSLARVIRGEILQLRESPYILTAGKLGKSKGWIAIHHMVPNVLPQFLTGMILLFPHAILHESSVTFLGFGLSAEQPAIGILLSESMRYLILGNWWLALFPGLLLVAVVMSVQAVGERLRQFADPAGAHR